MRSQHQLTVVVRIGMVWYGGTRTVGGILPKIENPAWQRKTRRSTWAKNVRSSRDKDVDGVALPTQAEDCFLCCQVKPNTVKQRQLLWFYCIFDLAAAQRCYCVRSASEWYQYGTILKSLPTTFTSAYLFHDGVPYHLMCLCQ